MQKQKTYSTRLNDDLDTRIQIALLRLVGCSAAEIAEETERHVKTIELEIKRTEHKDLLRKYLLGISRKEKLPEDKKQVVEAYIEERYA